MTYYPSCITDSQICNKCYASESCQNCTDGSGNHPCSAYCNSGCNTICISEQTFCALGVEVTIDHADVKPYPQGCWEKDQFIFRNWTAEMWNNVLGWIDDTAKLGVEQNQGTPPGHTKVNPDPDNVTHVENSLVTAEKYNQMVAKINFFNQSLATVKQGDVIRGTHAMALKDGYEDKTFNQDVCDVCNVPDQNRNSCNCSCVCSCSCSCNCTCSCPCYCGCTSGGRS